MSKRRRRWPWILLSLVVALFVAKHFLLDTAAEARGDYVIDLPALHRAAAGGGPLPEGIEVERIGTIRSASNRTWRPAFIAKDSAAFDAEQRPAPTTISATLVLQGRVPTSTHD